MDINNSTIQSGNFTQNVNNTNRPAGPNGTPPPPPQGNGQQGDTVQLGQAHHAQVGAYNAQGTQATQRMQGSTPPPPASAVNGANSDTVELSSEGVLRQEAYNVAMSTPDVRQDRVNSLRAQVQNGTYQIDSRELANNLVRDEAAFSAIS